MLSMDLLLERLDIQRTAAGQIRDTARRQVARDLAERPAQALFQRGVIEGHSQQVMNGEVPTNRKGQKMCDVLSGGCSHLGAQQAPVLSRRVDAQQPSVFLHNAGASLAGEICFADQTLIQIELAEASADDGDFGIGEHDRQGCAA